jgi:hypothetical protein
MGTQWVSHGGPRNERGIGTSRLATHAAVAVVGLFLWFVYALGGNAAFGWLAIGALAVVIAFGFWMFAIWLRGRSARDRRTEMPAETAFPVPLIFGHGLLAATTFVLALLAVLV